MYLFVNEFKGVMAPMLLETRLLPIEVPKSQEQVDYIYEQKPEELLGTLLPRYIKLQVYSALLESVAAEHAARMTAMDAASSNATDVIDKLLQATMECCGRRERTHPCSFPRPRLPAVQPDPEVEQEVQRDDCPVNEGKLQAGFIAALGTGPEQSRAA